jgi:hypothetical protein
MTQTTVSRPNRAEVDRIVLTKAPRLTEPQIKALRYLATVGYAAPNEIGQAIGGTRSGKAQGLGRLGGAIAHRLIKLDLAVDQSWRRGGFPAYAITQAGRIHPSLCAVPATAGDGDAN